MATAALAPRRDTYFLLGIVFYLAKPGDGALNHSSGAEVAPGKQNQVVLRNEVKNVSFPRSSYRKERRVCEGVGSPER